MASMGHVSSIEAVRDSKTKLLREVQPSTVCMVTDKAFDKPQIPVVVNGKVYYGCCAGCKMRLESAESYRKAKDPLSGVKVDKAIAIIGADQSGTVYYFENKDNLRKYMEK
tara:strand:- start:118 stop:450 length:333 start_codon:yes stop_codon:yes gene_type:complete